MQSWKKKRQSGLEGGFEHGVGCVEQRGVPHHTGVVVGGVFDKDSLEFYGFSVGSFQKISSFTLCGGLEMAFGVPKPGCHNSTC